LSHAAVFAIAFVAGVLATLSPCVLPLLPVVLAAAASQHRFGPLALAAGLAISFIAIGLFLATLGFSLGIDSGTLRLVAAAMIVALGVILVVPSFQARLAFAGGPVSNWAEHRFGGFSTMGLRGQFGLGLLLGAVWSPCVGPTLGAASLLAAQGKDLPQVALTMLMFGLGAVSPLVILGILSRKLVLQFQNRLFLTSKVAKTAFGTLLILIGLTIVTGVDKRIEAYLVDVSPPWLTQVTTRL
jgi:cytochrome c-type biogenesis protein